MLGTPQNILTVSELTLLVRDRLEQVSNLYFTLKDGTSQIRAVLFRTGAQRLRFTVREGVHVIIRGRLTVYEPRGEYQIVLDYVEPKGIGALQVAFEQLKDKLACEGLFDQPASARCLCSRAALAWLRPYQGRGNPGYTDRASSAVFDSQGLDLSGRSPRRCSSRADCPCRLRAEPIGRCGRDYRWTGRRVLRRSLVL